MGTVISATIRKDAGQDAERSADRNLPQAASRRSAHAGYRHPALPGHVLRPAQVRFLARGPHEVQHQAVRPAPTPPPLDKRTLDSEDFSATIRYLLKLRKGIGAVDDIDHLGNRRVRAVGELLENQFRIGLVRMERAIKEKMSVYQEMSTAMPHDLVNAKPVMAAIREFFGSSQLSQFMDQTNPLSRDHAQAASLGPGTGRSVPRARRIRSPRRAPHALRPHLPHRNAGRSEHRSDFVAVLLRAHQRIRLHREPVPQGDQGRGDRRSPDPEPRRHRLQGRRHRARAPKSKKPTASSAPRSSRPNTKPTASTSRRGKKTSGPSPRPTWSWTRRAASFPILSNARQAGNFVLKPRDEIEYIDVSPKQLVSVAASLIPFLENDDANRALMGSNMQRQAVPLLRADAPYVGTGMEHVTARDSGAVVLCKRAGVVDSVDSERIIVRVEGAAHEGQLSREVGADIYQLTKFKRSNQNTCINQKPIVPVGQRVAKGAGAGRRSLHRSWANWPWDATCWWPSCPGAATTSKTPSWSARSWSRKTTTPRSTSKSSKSKRATPSWGRKKSPATFPTSRIRSCATWTRAASSASAPR